ncbi:hypothetical protein [uncultured Lamprocystis sp.]|jgi:type I restriction enzyme S subunit|uniref:hypothetical protein n=1 Tax=uncultured Lamprocystis sp. TaxID=543132 RepID=UPI0025E3AC8B|nr:hypothetical protein [uncultured Lamprocystis sp.]
MSFASFKNARVVRSSWLEEGGRRLDCNPYMSGALEARDILRQLSVRKDLLSTLTAGYVGGIYNGPMFKRNYVESPEHGVPFISSGTIMLADLSRLPLLRRKDAESSRLSYLRLEAGMTLISCSGTIGRMCYVRPDMDGIWSSQDVLKVSANTSLISPGYLYAFLASRYGVPLVVSGTYGAIIQHIEPEHIAGLPVPRFGAVFEVSVDAKMQEAVQLLSNYQRLVREATNEVFASVGLEDISATEWHADGLNLGFSVAAPYVASLRALNFNPKFVELVRKIKKGPSSSTLAISGSRGQLIQHALPILAGNNEGVRVCG